MIITVKPQSGNTELRYHYNAPNSIHVGDLVELPMDGSKFTWVGEVTQIGLAAARTLGTSGWAGPIKAIVGRAPLKVELEANTRNELRQKLQDALDALDDGEGRFEL